MNKSISSIVCLLVLAAACSSWAEARPKRSVYVVPVVQTAHVVHSNPTSVVKTEHVKSGNHASYTYTSEVNNQPVVHTHTHTAAAPVVAAAPVAAAPVAAAVVPHAYYSYQHAYYPTAYSYYSPYSYVVGK